MHSLLKRQLRRAAIGDPSANVVFERLLELVSQAYVEADEHQSMVERSLEIMSDELHARNRQLQHQLLAVGQQAWVLAQFRDAALLVSAAGTVVQGYAATESLFARELGSMIGQPLERFLTLPAEFASFAEWLKRLSHDHPTVLDVSFERASDRAGTLELSVTMLRPATDADAVALVVARDVTDRRRMEQSLLQSQKLEGIGQLAAGVAHEINTPAQYVSDNLRFLENAFQQLTAADGSGAASDDREFLAEEVPGALRQSLEGMQRISEIVAGIRLFAHPGGGEATRVDLKRELETTIAVSRNEWKYVAELTTDLATDVPPVPTYPGELGHVFLNLIVNAAQALGSADAAGRAEKGNIRVSSRRDGAWVEVRVADDGPGIPEEIRTRVFDPFFTTKPVGKGTGQGLAICHRIVEEKHRGTLTFESAVGRGTTFIVRLPLDADQADAHRAAA